VKDCLKIWRPFQNPKNARLIDSVQVLRRKSEKDPVDGAKRGKIDK